MSSPEINYAEPSSGVRRSSFAANVLKLVSGSASAQVLTVLTAPLVARLFAPEAFGAAALFAAITGLISAVVGMRYELSILLPEKDEEAANAAAVSLCFVVLTTLLTAGLIAVADRPMLRLFHAEALRGYIWLAPVNVLLNGISAVFSYWCTRKKSFWPLTISQVVSTVFFVVTQIGAGLAGYSSGGTIITLTVMSVLVGTLVLAVPVVWQAGRLFVHAVSFRGVWGALKRYSSFPKFSTASAVLHNLGWQMPTFILSAFFSSAVVGFYALGNRVLRVPVNLLGANIATVFFQHASEANYSGTLTSSVDRLFRYLAGIFVFPSLLLALIGRELFVIAFGARWAEAGIYTQILSIYVLFWFISVPLGIALNVMERQALELRLIVTVLLVRAAALLAGGALGDPRWTLALFSVAGTIAYFYYCAVVLRQVGVSLAPLVRALGRSVVNFFPAGAVVAALKWSGASPLVIVGAATVMLLLYYLNLVRRDPTLRCVALDLLRNFLPVRRPASVGCAHLQPGRSHAE